MRSLNNSLPRAKSSKSEPPEQLLQAFKAAALSVTKLYKTAASDQARARNEGYQDALDDLLSFLDKEDIGLSDGEGWRIRRWATERLDGREQHIDSDEDLENQERATSPSLTRTQSANQAPAVAETSAPRTETPIIEEEPQVMLPPTSTFTFRSQQAYPLDSDMNSSDAETSDSTRAGLDGPPTPSSNHISTQHTPSTTSRSRHVTRQNSSNRQLSSRSPATSAARRTAGQKRRIDIGDFFDISNITHHRDGFGGAGGGGKRTRFA